MSVINDRPIHAGEVPYYDPETRVWYVDLVSVAMLDWDFTKPGVEAGTTIGSGDPPKAISGPEQWWDEVYPLLCSWPAFDGRHQVFFSYHSEGFRIYRTPNGFRALSLRPMRMFDWLHLADDTGVDQRYVHFCQERKAWSCRLSPKEGRKDFVAEYLCTTTGTAWGPAPRSLEVIRMHDAWCRATRNAPYPGPGHEYGDLRTAAQEMFYREPWDGLFHAMPLKDLDWEESLEVEPDHVVEWAGDFPVGEETGDFACLTRLLED